MTEATFVVRGARLFDGVRVKEAGVVVVRAGVIAEIGHRRPPGVEVPVIDGTGQTLLPGLIDAHVHTQSDLDGAALHLRQALATGVTTVLCMCTQSQTAAAMKVAAGERSDLADLRSSGWCATAPGGHPTQWGSDYPTIASREEAVEFVAARHAEGMDYIKIIIEDWVGRPCPCLPPEFTDVLVRDAHARGLPAVAHVSKRQHAEQALASGVDGLVHQYDDEAMTAEIAERIATAGTFVVMTLATKFKPEAAALAADSRLAPYIESSQLARLAASHVEHVGIVTEVHPGAARVLDAVGLLRDAGVTVLAGTDAPGIGAVGPSLHLELDLLVRGGLTPVEALAAATSAPADTFGLHDRGRVAPGYRADLILVAGDPTQDIDATKAITRIWRGGIELDRSAIIAQ